MGLARLAQCGKATSTACTRSPTRRVRLPRTSSRGRFRCTSTPRRPGWRATSRQRGRSSSRASSSTAGLATSTRIGRGRAGEPVLGRDQRRPARRGRAAPERERPAPPRATSRTCAPSSQSASPAVPPSGATGRVPASCSPRPTTRSPPRAWCLNRADQARVRPHRGHRAGRVRRSSSAISSWGCGSGGTPEELVDSFYGLDRAARRVGRPARARRAGRGRRRTARRRRRRSVARRPGGWLRATARKLAGERFSYVEEGQLVYGLRPLWHDEGDFEQGRRLLEAALPGQRRPPRPLRALVRRDGDPDRARRAGRARHGGRAAAAYARHDRAAGRRGLQARAHQEQAVVRLRALPRQPAQGLGERRRYPVPRGRSRPPHLARDLRGSPHAPRLAGRRAGARSRRGREDARPALVARGRAVGGDRGDGTGARRGRRGRRDRGQRCSGGSGSRSTRRSERRSRAAGS